MAEWIRHWTGNPEVVSSSLEGGRKKIVGERCGMWGEGKVCRGVTLLFIYMYFSNFEMFFLIFLISNTFCKIRRGKSLKNILKRVTKFTNFCNKEYSKNLKSLGCYLYETNCYYLLYKLIDVKSTTNRCTWKDTTAFRWIWLPVVKVTTWVQLGLTHS